MKIRIAIGTALILGSLLATACNMPFAGERAETEAEEPAAEAPAAEAPSEKEAEEAVSEPTEAPEEAIEEPQGTPIAHLDSGALILITHIQMITQQRSCGIGGLYGNSDHVFRTQNGGRTWTDVPPPASPP